MNKKIVNKIEKAIQERQEQTTALKRRIDQARAEIEKADAAMNTATTEDNEAEYIRAADKKRFNENVIAANEAKLQTMKMVVNESEYNAIIDEIKADARKSAEEAEKKAADLFGSLYALADNFSREVKECDQLLAKWANANGKDAMTVNYSPMNTELLTLKGELEKKKRNGENQKNLLGTIANARADAARIYEKIPAAANV